MTAIGYAWEIVALVIIAFALIDWFLITHSVEDDDDTWPWNAVDAATQHLKEARRVK